MEASEDVDNKGCFQLDQDFKKFPSPTANICAFAPAVRTYRQLDNRIDIVLNRLTIIFQ